jgi:metallo-beta-lactamase superfamily protein
MPTVPRKANKRSKATTTRRFGRSRPAPRVTTARKKKPATTPPQAPVVGNLPRVRVRMYRQGLGDCFLLTFNPGGDEKHVLIDCGTLGATSTKVTLPDVIADIDKTTNGHLHLVVATHQHQDHLSGFSKLSAQFSSANKKLIDHVWLAWTEDLQDTLANQLGQARDNMAIAVKSAAQALRATGGDNDEANAIDSLLGFFGDTAVTPGASGQADGATFAAAAKSSIDCVRDLVKQAEYRNPGEPAIELDWLPGFRFYVLGPPRDLDAIHDAGAHGSSELYALTALTRAALQQAGADKQAATADDSSSEAPFDQRFRLWRTDPRIVEALSKTYLDPSQSWRSVDADWLNSASGLAIQLDKFTNNTSLVIAIERIADGKVLLFPGDAQEGNWLSWQNPSITWQVNTPGGKTATVAAKDLLARTVFYKVGHHSSHNATAKAKGLEMMTSRSELTAFIPVDRQVALGRSPAGTWKMPARQLYRALLDKCEGRVVRSDIGWASNVKLGTRGTESEFVGLGTDAEWTTWSKSQQATTRVQIEANHIDFLLE